VSQAPSTERASANARTVDERDQLGHHLRDA